jgi:sugar/nucleoside kinase (ribokinase family)
MFDVITIGSGTRDVFLVSDQFTFLKSPKFPTGIGECMALGSKIELKAMVHTTGGGATNAAATFARFGIDAGCICRVGDDATGRDLIIDLYREGVGTTLIQRVEGGITGYSTLLTDAKSGERTVLVYRGVSGTFKPADIPWDACRARWFYLTSLGGNLPLTKKIISQAVYCGAAVAWNPGSKELKKGLGAIEEFLPRVQILMMNREEAMLLTGRDEIEGMFDRLATSGNVILITDGEHGAYAHRDGRTWHAGTAGSKAISRTGAGDAFGSGFVAAYMKTKDISKALAVGTLNADSVIRQIGAKAGILKRWPSASSMKRIAIKKL